MASLSSGLSAQARERLAFHRVDQWYSTIRVLIRYGVLALGLWCLYLSVDSIAGKTTAFTVGLSVL
jgi:hypothetical protein